MDAIQDMVEQAVADFQKVAALAGASLLVGAIKLEFLPKPHRPTALPPRHMAVYTFFLNGKALKVGKVGSNSGPRFTYQHYTGSALSTLSGSVMIHQTKLGLSNIDLVSAGEWIKTNTDRVNLIIPAEWGVPLLSLLESFLHVRWSPMFEGRIAVA